MTCSGLMQKSLLRHCLQNKRSMQIKLQTDIGKDEFRNGRKINT